MKFLCFIYQPIGKAEIEAEDREKAFEIVRSQIAPGLHIEVSQVIDVGDLVPSGEKGA